MINAIVNGIFSLILSLFNTLMSPFISVITALFPAVDTFFSYISSFLSYALTYISTIIDLLFIPRAALVLFFDYLLICYTIFLTVQAIRFAINIYNKFKL